MPPEVLDGQQISQQPNPSDWRGHLTDELKADPVVAGWAEKASEKDIGSIIKGYAHAQKRMGSAINIPGKDAKPEDIAALRSKLYESGVFKAPPGKPEEYGLTDPGNLPQGITFSPELAGKFATAMHKHGIPKEALADLMPVYLEAIQGQAVKLNTDYDKIVEGLRGEYGEKYAEREELADRLAKEIFKGHSEEGLKFLKDSGIGNLLLGPMFKLAHFAGQDSSYIDSLSAKDSTANGEAAKAELQAMMNDPKHPMHDAWKRNDPKATAHIQEVYKKAHGNAMQEV